MNWLKRLLGFQEPPTHELWVDGVEACINRVHDNGKRISVYGWSERHWPIQTGHFVRFLKREGGEVRPSTYRVLEDKHCGDPPDMYFLECEYVGSVPRTT